MPKIPDQPVTELPVAKSRGILAGHETPSPRKVGGQPPKAVEDKVVPVTFYVTPQQREVIKDKAGLVKLSAHLVHYLTESGYFEEE